MRTDFRWRLLRLSLGVCTAGVLAAGAAIGTAWWHERSVAAQVQASEARLAAARRHHLAITEAHRERQRFEPLFRRWAEIGRIGEERPAIWTELVRAASSDVLEDGPRPGAPRVIEREGAVEVRAVEMSIGLALRHEAELPALLAGLDENAPGLFTLTGCRLSRMDEAGESTPPPAVIRASCRIRWLTVVLPEADSGWLPAAVSDDAIGDARPEMPKSAWFRDEPVREGFGRLFTTVEDRAGIDSALARRDAPPMMAVPPDPVPAEPAPPQRPIRWIRVDGVIARAGRPVVAWVDGARVHQSGPHSEQTAPASIPSHRVRLDAGGPAITVRPGQRFNPRTGAVIDPVRRP